MGDWEDSLSAFQESIDLATEVNSNFAHIIGSQRLAVLETGLGRFDDAHQRLLEAKGRAAASDSPFVRIHSSTRIYGGLAQNRLDAGDLALATQYLAEGFAAQQEYGECVTCDVLLYPAAVPIYILLGDLDQAEWACTKIEDASSSFGSRAWFAYARLLRGMLASAQQDWAQVYLLLAESQDIFEEMGQPYETAINLEHLAEVIVKDGVPESATTGLQMLERAAGIYKELGSRPGQKRVEEKLKTPAN